MAVHITAHGKDISTDTPPVYSLSSLRAPGRYGLRSGRIRIISYRRLTRLLDSGKERLP